jgi:hypothetical protein
MDGTKHSEVLVISPSGRRRDRHQKNSKQQLKAEESVRQSEKQYRSLFSVLNEGVCARAKTEIQQIGVIKNREKCKHFDN